MGTRDRVLGDAQLQMPMEHGVGVNNVESTDNESDEIISATIGSIDRKDGNVDLTSEPLFDIN